MTHLALEFPRDIAQGYQAILERRDEVVTLASGHEETNQHWTHARRSWAAGLAIRSHDDLSKVVELFEEVRRHANSFHFRDWLDWRSASAPAPILPTDQMLRTPITDNTEYEPAAGDGVKTAFQITKRYGLINPHLRPIALPHATSLRVAVDGVEVTTGWALSPTGGVLTFDAPPALGASLTAGFTFDVPVRFSDNSLSVEWAYFNESVSSGMAPDITLIEKRLDWLI